MSLSGRSELEIRGREAWELFHQNKRSEWESAYECLLPYCLRVASRTCCRYINEQDEEAGIARMALVEALEKYQPDKGGFLVFLGQVIHHRLIDYKRREKRHQGIINLFPDDPREIAVVDVLDDQAIEQIVDDLARQQEISRLRKLLAAHGITFDDLVRANPKHASTRRATQAIARKIASDKELTNSVLNKKILPIKELEQRFSVNRKLLDRFRKYIIANVLIISHDLSYLKTYILPDGEGQE